MPSGPTPAAAVAETHSATVVFIGHRAYKVKKPVDLGFLDFTTRAARERACHREVQLNRRLAPDVYLGVDDVFGPDGEVCDHLVVMRRLPPERRLSHLLDTDGTSTACLRAVARQVAALHAAVPTSTDDPAIASVATRDAVAGNWQDNLEAIRPFVDDVVPSDEFRQVEDLVGRYLDGRAALFDDRIAAGMVRDGHGDLLAEDIFCLDDGPRIIDCLDFDDRYRYGDVLLDVAFLAMDLERLGHPEQARQFLDWYEEFAGERQPTSLLHHYLAYRAHVRVKVACVRHAQGDPSSARMARDLHRVVHDHLARARVTLVLVGGLPGTGKSTLASGLSDAEEWAVLRSDEIRKDLAGLAHDVDAASGDWQGLYRPDRVDQVYGEMLHRARHLLERGESVVLDASWTSAARRQAAIELADATSSDLVQLRCDCPAEVARARLADRRADPSDASARVYDAMAAREGGWPAATPVPTNRPVDAMLVAARAAVRHQLDRGAGLGA